MLKNRLVQYVSVAVMLACIGVAMALTPSIYQQRQDLQLTFEMQDDAMVPPEMALADVWLGVFRGLYIDYLWHRANVLKEQGQYAEANTLSNLITTLQPRFAQVWAFHAWNMAYNISVETVTPEERWQWVNKGIELLRQRGLRYNPKSVLLYRELSNLFFHKIGQFADDMHWYYKVQLAHEWQEVMGAPTLNTPTDQVIEQFRLIVDAPRTLTQLVAQSPEVQPLLERFAELGYGPDEQLLRQIGRVAIYTGSLDMRAFGVPFSELPDTVDRRVLEMLASEQDPPGLEPLLNYLRRKVIIERYNMKPQVMLELMQRFGPIDWRHHAAHSLYWGYLGIEAAEYAREKERIDAVNTDRRVMHALQDLFYYGRISYNPFPIGEGRIDIASDLRFAQAYETALDDALVRLRSEEYGPGVMDTFEGGHENFLLQVMQDLYLAGDTQRAADYYARLRDLYGDKMHNRVRYRMPLDRLVIELMYNNWNANSDARHFLDMMIWRALSEGLAADNAPRFEHFVRTAAEYHKKFNNKELINPHAPQQRGLLLSFREIFEANYVTVMQSPQWSLLAKVRIWARTPDSVRRSVYERLRTTLNTMAQRAGLDPATVFPPPIEGDAPEQQQDVEQYWDLPGLQPSVEQS